MELKNRRWENIKQKKNKRNCKVFGVMEEIYDRV